MRRDKSLVRELEEERGKEIEVGETKAGDGALSLGGRLALARGRRERRMAGLLGNYTLATAVRSTTADGLGFSPRSRRREAWGAWGGRGSDRARMVLRWARGPGLLCPPTGPAALPRYTHHRAWGRRPSWS